MYLGSVLTLEHTVQKSSPVLSGYRKHVSDVFTDHGIAEISDDEIDDNFENTDNLKKILNVNEKKEVSNQDRVPFEKDDSDKVRKSFEKKDDKTEDLALKDGQPSLDYSVATALRGKKEQNLKHCDLSTGESQKEDKEEFPNSELNVMRSENIEDIDVKPVISQGDSDSKIEEVEMIQDEEDIQRFLDSSDSQEVDFVDFCCDVNESLNPYKDPDQVSLGDGSTISDVSDSSMTDFEGIKNPDECFDIVEEMGTTETGKATNEAGLGVEHAGEHVSITSEENLDNMANTDIKQEENVIQDDQLSDGGIGVGNKLHNMSNMSKSSKEGQEESLIQDNKSVSGHTSLEPYIIAGLGSNGFVKSSKPKENVNTLKLKEKALSEFFNSPNDLSSMNGPFPTNSETSN